MKCPKCQHDFPLTWTRYFRSPLGRMTCPSCGVRLVGRHRWFYWPAMALGGALLCVPLSLLGYRLTGSIVVTMVAATVGWVLSGFPIDRYLEARFAVLKVAGKGKTPPVEVLTEAEESSAESVQEPAGGGPAEAECNR